MTSATSILPIELWEDVIDFVATDEYWPRYRPTLSACCLVCRAWVPRCRMHLSEVVVLTSRKAAISFALFMASCPIMSRNTTRLTISGDYFPDNVDQSWVSFVPLHAFQFGVPSPEELYLERIDFNTLSVDFFKYISLLKPYRIHLDNPFNATYTQISRLFAAVRPEMIRLQHSPMREVPIKPGKLVLSGQQLTDVELEGSYSLLGNLGHAMQISSPALRNLKVAIRVDDDQIDRGMVTSDSDEWAQILRQFRRFEGSQGVWVDMTRLYPRDMSLLAIYEVHTDPHKPVFDTPEDGHDSWETSGRVLAAKFRSTRTYWELYPDFLQCFSALDPHTIVLDIVTWDLQDFIPETWQPIDNALRLLSQFSLKRIQVRLCTTVKSFQELQEKYSSMNAWSRAILPQCASRYLLSVSNRLYPLHCCWHHERRTYQQEHIAWPGVVVQRSS